LELNWRFRLFGGGVARDSNRILVFDWQSVFLEQLLNLGEKYRVLVRRLTLCSTYDLFFCRSRDSFSVSSDQGHAHAQFN
jgi:hypothetical protein